MTKGEQKQVPQDAWEEKVFRNKTAVHSLPPSHQRGQLWAVLFGLRVSELFGTFKFPSPQYEMIPILMENCED